MSSAVASTSAALGRLFVFEDEADSAEPCHPERSGKCAKRTSRGVAGSLPSIHPGWAPVVPASQLGMRPAPEMASSGIAALDALTGGLPRGCLSEICGSASSGRTTVLLAALAAATRRGEFCAVVDASDSLDPHSAAAAGVDLDRLLWVRCGEDAPLKKNSPQRHRDTEESFLEKRIQTLSADAPFLPRSLRQEWGFAAEKISSKHSPEHRLEQALRATDLLLESGGFGLIVLDLADLPLRDARRIPLTTWFRFRRAVENKPTILLALEQQAIAGSCSSLLLQLGLPKQEPSSFARPDSPLRQAQGRLSLLSPHDSLHEPLHLHPAHADLLSGIEISVELTRSRFERKPARSIAFAAKTAWAG